jgi:hypothetical protein
MVEMLRGWIRLVVPASFVLLQTYFAMSSIAAPPTPQRPIASVRLNVSDSARDQFIDRLKKFGEADAFAIRVVHTRRDDQHFLVELWRADVNITAINPFDDPKEFGVFIYQTGLDAVSPAQLDALMNDLKGISEIPGVTIVTIKR